MSFVFQDWNILNNSELRGERRALRGWFNHADWSHNPRQIIWLTYWMDHRLFGLDDNKWRRTSMLLHLMTAGLLAVLSPIGAILFAVHPLTLMGSSYIAGRSGLLSATFQLAIVYAVLSGSLLLAILLSIIAIRWLKEDSILFLTMIAFLWLRP